MVAKTWCGELVQLLHCFVCHFAVPFNTFLRMTFHFERTRRNVCTIFSDSSNFFSCSCSDARFELFTVLVTHTFVRFTFALSASQLHVIKGQRRLSQINVFHQFLPHGIEILLLSSQFDVIHRETGIDLADDAQTSMPSLLLSPIHFPTELFSNCPYPQ